ncbi:hypothetical protein SAMN04489727_2156 [Amycolatopsis tolypomycina]|uniref:Uncharacterized protein n=1 Tax=Amycolatopsis tolypomycina TaxID=208445 RepID=A0A1H4JQS6_9PSEU|nr:hypothetical protein [Amycolatopsis tolypomycina]SEB48603.1 hypothetical protein SAMN04489727_2119 [Amycolatopsis tolypomycina]SEB49145.1 hypothetical protein SAMN04489727_2156 [Amycolatopsis tolypomycina]
MRIRVEGTEAEIAAAVAVITTVLDVQEASGFYRNRGASKLGRVYLTVVAPASPAGPVQATAERADRPQSNSRVPTRHRKEIR